MILKKKAVRFFILLAVVALLGFIMRGKDTGEFTRKTSTSTPSTQTPVTTNTLPATTTDDTSTSTTSTKIAPATKELIVVNKITSPAGTPLTVSGKARGQWYFEASFPIELQDASGTRIATGIGKAEGDWMTENFVPFTAALHFAPPQTNTGMLILKKDNPSGLPEHDAEVHVPVTFRTIKATPQDTALYLGFISEKDAANKDCTSVLASPRLIPKTSGVAKGAITELLKGPTLGEIGDGMLTLIPNGTELRSLKIDSGTAYVDFTEKLNSGVTGSCRVGAIRAQIEETLKQFPTVQDVVISVNGKTEGILEP